MASYLGNELPIPLSVISEIYLNKILTNAAITNNRFLNDGKHTHDSNFETINKALNSIDLYECELLKVLNKLIDIDCHHRILYVDCKSDIKSNKNWINLIEKKFCLLKPITYVSCTLDNGYLNDYILDEIAGRQFDLIIIKNCIQHIYMSDQFIQRLFELHCKENTKASILAIQRLFKSNCLPFYDSIYKTWRDTDINIDDFLFSLSSYKFDVMHTIEQLECDLSKMNWLLSLTNKDIYPLNFINENLIESNHGVREICEGIFKYNDDSSKYVFRDRLLFCNIKRTDNYFKSKNFKMSSLASRKSDIPFKPRLEPMDMIESLYELNPALKNKLSIKPNRKYMPS